MFISLNFILSSVDFKNANGLMLKEVVYLVKIEQTFNQKNIINLSNFEQPVIL